MAFVRALAMFAVALCFMLAVNAAAVDGQREVRVASILAYV